MSSRGTNGWPHSPQNLLESEFSAPHLEQRIRTLREAGLPPTGVSATGSVYNRPSKGGYPVAVTTSRLLSIRRAGLANGCTQALRRPGCLIGRQGRDGDLLEITDLAEIGPGIVGAVEDRLK